MNAILNAYGWPMAMLLFVACASVYLHYGYAQGPWFKAVYLDERDPFLASAALADAIVDSDERSATIYAESNEIQQALRNSGAVLIDPKGIPLCLSQ